MVSSVAPQAGPKRRTLGGPVVEVHDPIGVDVRVVEGELRSGAFAREKRLLVTADDDRVNEEVQFIYEPVRRAARGPACRCR